MVKMPMSKQKSSARKQLRQAYTKPYGKPTPFYSRKYNQWFKSYESYLKYDNAQKKQYSRNANQNLEYKDGYLYDKNTGRKLAKPTSAFRH